MSEIRIDYSNARQQARKLQEAAAQCEDAIRELRRAESEIPSCWTGEAATAYLQGLEKRIEEISRIRRQADDLADMIRTTAARFEEAERRTKEAIAAAFE